MGLLGLSALPPEVMPIEHNAQKQQGSFRRRTYVAESPSPATVAKAATGAASAAAAAATGAKVEVLPSISGIPTTSTFSNSEAAAVEAEVYSIIVTDAGREDSTSSEEEDIGRRRRSSRSSGGGGGRRDIVERKVEPTRRLCRRDSSGPVRGGEGGRGGFEATICNDRLRESSPRLTETDIDDRFVRAIMNLMARFPVPPSTSFSSSKGVTAATGGNMREIGAPLLTSGGGGDRQGGGSSFGGKRRGLYPSKSFNSWRENRQQSRPRQQQQLHQELLDNLGESQRQRNPIFQQHHQQQHQQRHEQQCEDAHRVCELADPVKRNYTMGDTFEL